MYINSFKKLKLPNKPGVYLFKKNNKILYIGKATSLNNRVRSYVLKGILEIRGPIIEKMISEASRVDFQVTDSVLEALILEATLIKRYQPKYNTKEKSDKSFLSVVITGDKIPRVFTVRTRNLKEGTGFVNSAKIAKMYGPFTNGAQLREALKIIRKIFPYLEEKYKNNYQFYTQVDLVPDIHSISGIKKYKNDIKNLKLFFEGKKKVVLKNLQKEMQEYAKLQEFEKAGKVKKQIFALKHINDVALIRESFVKSIPSSGPRIPGSPTPARPFRRNAFDFAKPFRVEAYDVAHMSGKNMVGAMVVIEGGEAIKREYKKFKIRTQDGANDTGALREVLERRLKHTEWTYPGLIVIDGGMAQLNVAHKVLQEMNLKIEVVSVVKNEAHKPKGIMGNEGLITKHKRAILLGNSEAHRFAIAYHKNMRAKNFLK